MTESQTIGKPTMTLGLIGLGLALIGPGIVATVLKTGDFGDPVPMGFQAMGLFAILAITAVVILIARKGEGASWAGIGWRKPDFWTIPIGLGLAVFFIYCFGPFAYWLASLLPGNGFAEGADDFSHLPIWYFATAIALISLTEEILYRGYAIERLTAMTGNKWVAVIVSISIFGIAHSPVWGPAVAVTTVLSGLVMSLVYLRRREVWSLAIAHILTNSYGLIITYML